MRRALLLVVGWLFSIPLSAQEKPRTDGWVVLPVEEYRDLRRKAYPPDPEPSPPPVEAALTRIDYDLKVAGEMASGEARLAVDVFKEGLVRIPIPAGILVSAARVDGRPVSVIRDTKGKGAAIPYVLVPRTGRSVLSLEIVVPVNVAAGTESILLPAGIAAVSGVTLRLPRQGIDLQVTGGLISERIELTEGIRLTAHGHPGEPLGVSWHRKREDRRAEHPLRYRGSVTELVGMGEDSAQANATIGVEVVQGLASAIQLDLPAGFVVNQVTGPTIGDWETTANTLSVKLIEPAEGTVAFVVIGELRAPRSGVVAVPLLRLPAAERETGGVAVEVLGSGEIKASQSKGLDAADPSELGGPVSGRDTPSLVAYRFRPQDGRSARALSVSVTRYTPQEILVATVEEAHFQALFAEDGKRLVRARYAVRNNAKTFLGLRLPQGATLWSAAVSGRPVKPGVSAEGMILMPLAKGRAGEQAPPFPVEIVYLERGPAWQARGRDRLTLPAADLPVNRSGVALHHSSRYKLAPEPGAFREQYFEPATSALRDLAPPPPPPPAPAPEGAEQKQTQDKPAAVVSQDETQALIERFQKAGRGSRVAGTLPVQVPFPAVGSAISLSSELTGEGQAPQVEFSYVRRGK